MKILIEYENLGYRIHIYNRPDILILSCMDMYVLMLHFLD